VGVLCGAGQAADATPCGDIATQIRSLKLKGDAIDQQSDLLARTGVQLDTGDGYDSFDAAFAALDGITIDQAATTFIFDERYLDRSQAPVMLFDHRSDGGFVALSQTLGSLGCTKMAIFLEKDGALVPATGSPEDDCPIYEGSYFAVATVDGRPYPAVVERIDGAETSIALYSLPVPDLVTEHALCSVVLNQ
jgi:hypothetical protein